MTNVSATNNVRAARPSDAAAIGAVHARAVRGQYAFLPADVLTAHDPQALAAAWQAAVENPPSAADAVFVAISDDLTVGFAAIDHAGEIVALWVDPIHQRRGHGSRLLAAVADHARTVGRQALSVWCPVPDGPRRAFLVSAGFAPDGSWRDLGQDSDAQLREDRLTAGLGSATDPPAESDSAGTA